MGTIADAYKYIQYVCRDLNPDPTDPDYGRHKPFAYYRPNFNNQSARWGLQEYYAYGGYYYMYDCSSLIGAALVSAGILPGSIIPGFYTGNMNEILTQNGFSRFDPKTNTLQPGDILLNHNAFSQHTEMLERYENGSWYSMGAHNSQLPVSSQIDSRRTNINTWDNAYRLNPQQSAYIDWNNFRFYARYYTGTEVFDRQSMEAYMNACMIASVLMSQTVYPYVNRLNINYDYPQNRNVWTKQAVCALLGNIEIECGYNPAAFEGGILPLQENYFNAVYLANDYQNVKTQLENLNYYGGYGFVQYTGSYKYIGLNYISNPNFENSLAYQDMGDSYYAGGGIIYTDPDPQGNIDMIQKYPYYKPAFYKVNAQSQSTIYEEQLSPFNDGIYVFKDVVEGTDLGFRDAYAQLLFLSNECCPREWNDNVIPDLEDMSFLEFIKYNEDIVPDYSNLDMLTEQFMRRFEKPYSLSTLETRCEAARFWWDRLKNMVAITPPIYPDARKGKPIWLKCIVPQIDIKL